MLVILGKTTFESRNKIDFQLVLLVIFENNYENQTKQKKKQLRTERYVMQY